MRAHASVGQAPAEGWLWRGGSESLITSRLLAHLRQDNDLVQAFTGSVGVSPAFLQRRRQRPAFRRFLRTCRRDAGGPCARKRTRQRGASPLQAYALRPEAEGNCAAVRRGGEQPKVRDRSVG